MKAIILVNNIDRAMEEFDGKTFLFRHMENYRHAGIKELFIVTSKVHHMMIPPDYFKFIKLSLVEPEDLNYIVEPTRFTFIQESDYFITQQLGELLSVQISSGSDIVFSLSHLGLLGGTYFVNGGIYLDMPPVTTSFRSKVLPFAVNTGRKCLGVVFPADVYDLKRDVDKEFLKDYLRTL